MIKDGDYCRIQVAQRNAETTKSLGDGPKVKIAKFEANDFRRQTPGFIGVGRKYLLSKKFISADGGLLRVAWMPKDLKNAMADGIRKRTEELGVPDFLAKIADETITTDAEGLASWMSKVDHPALKMTSLLE